MYWKQEGRTHNKQLEVDKLDGVENNGVKRCRVLVPMMPLVYSLVDKWDVIYSKTS